MILVNFKNYRKTFGSGSEELCKICYETADKTGVKIIPVVAAINAVYLKRKFEREVYLQNVDVAEEGQHSGAVSVAAAAEAGLDGSLLNHSEARKKPGTIKKILKKWPKEKMRSVVCLQSWGQVESWGKNLEADMVAYEPTKLIGSKDKSVVGEMAKVALKVIFFYRPKMVLVGAGIKGKDDVTGAIKLGAGGVLVASWVVESDEWRRRLLELASGFSV